MHCTYKHWGSLAYPLFPCKINKYYTFWVCVCSLSYSACIAHELNFTVIWSMSGCTIVFYTVSQTVGFWKKKMLLNIKYVLIFSTTLSEKFLILRRTERVIINVYRSLGQVPVILDIFLINLEFSRQIFEKSSNTKFRENPASGSRIVPYRPIDAQTDRQTDRHDKANSLFSQFSESI